MKQEQNTNRGKRGFVHFVDNPVLVRSMVNTLSAYGLSLGDITIGDDARILARSMSAGETLVINSFFDFSSDFSKMLYIVEDILRAGITIVSISDNGMEIKPGYTDSLGLVSIFKNYLSFSDKNDVQIDKNPIPQDFPTLHLASLSEKEHGFLTALDLCQRGHTMASAARIAGCSYTSFRYWLQNKVMQDNATGGMREIPDQR